MLPIDIENPYRLSRGVFIYIYIYIHTCTYTHTYIYIFVDFLVSHLSDLSRCISKFTEWAIIEELSIRRQPRTFLISCGQKNACITLLCWSIVMIWVLVCNNMYQCERHFGFFYRNSTILETVWVNTENLFIEIQRQEIIPALMCLC